MPTSISAIIADPDTILALQPEELAGAILQYLNAMSPQQQKDVLNPHVLCGRYGVQGYPPDYRERISRALMEGWVWLEREGLLAPIPGDDHGWAFITRRGLQMKNAADLTAFTKANLLPRQLLHPILSTKVWSSFLRGDYDTAVFQAFKEVEVAVRAAAGFPATDIGVPLMRKAFDKTAGPLSDAGAPDDAEKDAMSHLFAGAIGLYKNPGSHRNVSVKDPSEAVELILLASHLLRIVEHRKPGN
jgi:uncharacterized protein (TIGR02391 family)